jgi:L-lactate utilization protein LutB
VWANASYHAELIGTDRFLELLEKARVIVRLVNTELFAEAPTSFSTRWDGHVRDELADAMSELRKCAREELRHS